MVLVDSSVWIEVFRKGTDTPLSDLVDVDEIVTCLPVTQEVLQGFRDQRAFQIAHDAMHAFPIVESPLRQVVFDEAVHLYRLARRAGLTVHSGVDCLIAACALRNRLTVLPTTGTSTDWPKSPTWTSERCEPASNRPKSTFDTPYSVRIASIGSTAEARRAGR